MIHISTSCPSYFLGLLEVCAALHYNHALAGQEPFIAKGQGIMKKFSLFFKTFAAASSAALVLAAPVFAQTSPTPDTGSKTVVTGAPKVAISEGHALLNSMQDHIINVSDRVKGMVVHIESISKVGNQRRKSTGSGLILSADGKIVTNYHVIDKAQLITVILDDKTKYTAEVTRDDQQTDLAFLKIKPNKPLLFATLADSDKIKVGEWVIAVGNPYGFDRTVSFGIVSGKGRFIPGADNGAPLINDFIQIDAMIDPGNSGGPLVNMNGEVIGINSIGVGRGQGFTIPSNVVKDVADRLEVNGQIQRGWLGIFMQTFTDEHAEFIKQPNLRGLLVSDVAPGSPSEKAGLRSGDVITHFNGKAINADTDEALSRIQFDVAQLLPNEKVPVEYFRNGKTFNTVVTLGVRPAVNTNDMETSYGFTVQEITANNELEYRLLSKDGMLVSKVDSGSAAANGLKVGDVIIRLNDTPIHNAKDLKKALNDVHDDKYFLITAKRGRVQVYCLIDTSTYSNAENKKQEENK